MQCKVCGIDISPDNMTATAIKRNIAMCKSCYNHQQNEYKKARKMRGYAIAPSDRRLSHHTCIICNKILPLDSFHDDNLKKCHYICKTCKPKSAQIIRDALINSYIINMNSEKPLNHIYIHMNPYKPNQLVSFTILNNVNNGQIYHGTVNYVDVILSTLSNVKYPNSIDTIYLDNMDIIKNLNYVLHSNDLSDPLIYLRYQHQFTIEHFKLSKFYPL